ncbi:kinase-like domain-containing protein [Rhizophagus clarus]|uniref:Kinase-like domain-containing protein n=1 Tax=Rhizophagus clarus TaxID=94130 RepID=A0A8H3MEH5_9GLOM|nr:kinase-like domain-containing protein [Rhizophagus clarus]
MDCKCGGFGHIKYADWPCSDRKVAIKELKSYDVRKFVEEVKIHSSSHSSNNIVRFFGLTRELPSNEYMMVMEYADLRSLRNFLSQKDVIIDWETKYRLSLDIAKGLYCLHSRNVAHRDLHTNNIVIKRANTDNPCCRPKFIAQITDFGGAISMNEGVIDVYEDFGQVAFTDPKFLNGIGSYKKDLCSDIYSMGVIFWEISSAIIDGLRETPTPETPENYIKLYKACWEREPSRRPIIEQIIEALNTEFKNILEQAHELKGNNVIISINLNEQARGVKRVTGYFPLENKKAKLLKSI